MRFWLFCASGPSSPRSTGTSFKSRPTPRNAEARMPAPEMNALVRVNGSRRIGAGHVMRCLVLAERLSARGVGVTFVADDFGDRVTDVIRERGYALRLFPASGTGEPWLGSDLPTEIRAMRELIEGLAHPLDWLIVDNYGIDARWERALRPYARKIMVIDDLADRPHDCDVLLDQNECDDLEHRYVRLVAPSTVRFLGASYALLRREFIEAGRSLRIRDGRVRRILIAFGATDPTGETKKALRALRLAGLRDVAVDVVVGRWAVQAVDDERVELDCPVRFHHDVGSLAPLMVAADGDRSRRDRDLGACLPRAADDRAGGRRESVRDRADAGPSRDSVDARIRRSDG